MSSSSVAAFLSHTPAEFLAAYGQYFQGGVSKVLSDAAAKGYSPGATLANLGPIVAVLFVSIGPYPVMQMVGSEIKNPRRSLLYGLVLAEIVSILVWFGLTYLFDNVVGITFLEAWTLTVGGGASTVPTVFVTLFYPNNVILWFMTIGLFIGNIGWSWLGLVFISRLFMAWSFDRVLPSALANVNDRFHTPHIAIVLACTLACIPMYLEYFTSFITVQVNLVFLFSIVWFLTSISAIVLPFMKRDFRSIRCPVETGRSSHHFITWSPRSRPVRLLGLQFNNKPSSRALRVWCSAIRSGISSKCLVGVRRILLFQQVPWSRSPASIPSTSTRLIQPDASLVT